MTDHAKIKRFLTSNFSVDDPTANAMAAKALATFHKTERDARVPGNVRHCPTIGESANQQRSQPNKASSVAD